MAPGPYISATSSPAVGLRRENTRLHPRDRPQQEVGHRRAHAQRREHVAAGAIQLIQPQDVRPVAQLQCTSAAPTQEQMNLMPLCGRQS